MAKPQYPGDIVDGAQIFNYEVNVRSSPIFEALDPTVTSGEGIRPSNITRDIGISPDRFTLGGLVTTQGTDSQTIASGIKHVGVPRYDINILRGTSGEEIPDVSGGNVFVWDYDLVGTDISNFDYGGSDAVAGHIVYIKKSPRLPDLVPQLDYAGATYPYGSGVGSGIWGKDAEVAQNIPSGQVFCYVCIGDPTSEGDVRWIQIASIPA